MRKIVAALLAALSLAACAGAEDFDGDALARIGGFLSSFTEIPPGRFMDIPSVDEMSANDLIWFAVVHEHINDPKRFSRVPGGRAAIGQHHIANAVERYFGRALPEHMTAIKTPNGAAFEYDARRKRYVVDPAECAKSGVSARAESARADGDEIVVDGTIICDEDIMPSFTARVRPLKRNGRDSWALVSFATVTLPDLSALWRGRSDFIGALGDGSRLRIKFESVERVSQKGYETTGVMMIGDDGTIPLSGRIDVDEVFELGEWEHDVDWRLDPSRGYCERVLDRYKGTEKRPHYVSANLTIGAGMFRLIGRMRSICVADAPGEASLEEELRSDEGWVNDMFIGELFDHASAIEAAFGLGRLPLDGLPDAVRDIDSGGGEFWPRDKYLHLGWRSLDELRRDSQNEELRARERDWWKR